MNAPSRHCRRGSALLIVLGMLSFMIVSAVAFAAFMRYSRMPSSYLRRSSASRLLAKAALARAVDRIDMAVNNNPHPNLGSRTVVAGVDGKRRNLGSDYYRTANHWHSRVLMATNDWSGIDIDDTIPTLTLEGLAYIPPPLVNEVRYFSRRTPTAMWDTLDFDSGRYAFCAIDVSDYLDVNRMLADYPRNSSPGGRIRLGHIFERSDHSSAPSSANQWDTFMDSFRVFDVDTFKFGFWTAAKPPLVSLADFNLALGKKGSAANFKSPFAEFVKQGSGSFYASTGNGPEQEERLRNMTFVTDGYFPAADVSDRGDIGDLVSGEGQPFQGAWLNAAANASTAAARLTQIFKAGTDSKMKKWRDVLSVVGLVSLYDYLDADHLPVSLSCPTLERVPMVCGVEPSLSGCKFAVTEKVAVKEGEGDGLVSGGGEQDASRVVKRVVTYTIDTKQFKPRSVDALLMFPFNHEDRSDASGFTVDGQFSLFLSSEQMGLRLVDQRLKDTDVLRIKSKSLSSSGFDNGVVRITMSPKAVTKPANIDQQEGAIQKVMLPLQSALGTILSQMQGTPLLTVTYQWEQTRDMGSEGGMSGMGDWRPAFDGIKDDASKITATSGFKVLKANGSEDGDFSAGNLGALVAGAGKKVRLNAAVWLRVLNNNSQVVDMVPACLADDEDQRAGNLQVLKPLAAPISGDRTPLMKFETGVSFDFSIAGLQGLSAGIDMQAAPKAALVNDPRFNHAPENWFKYESSLSENGYLTELNNTLQLGANGRDGDIFMATSDSGYMQSAYELAFIPRFTNLKNYGSSQVSGDLTSLSGLDWKEFPDNAGSTRQAGFAWRTYAPYGDDAEAFEDLGISSDGTGQKVNPYSDSVNVLMSVFANTPIDWKRSSTNQVSGAPDYATMSAREFNSLYAFNGYGQNCRIEWDDLKAVAEAYTNCVGELFRNGRDDGATWEDAFNNLGWDYVEDELCGVRLSQNDAKHRLWSVDRKFLYGFWHDCMTPRQQLYIVFVRAEPMMMGGTGTGGVPPQLGSRAVAVVWRDPTPATQPEYPHRTRVLFYRQFE